MKLPVQLITTSSRKFYLKTLHNKLYTSVCTISKKQLRQCNLAVAMRVCAGTSLLWTCVLTLKYQVYAQVTMKHLVICTLTSLQFEIIQTVEGVTGFKYVQTLIYQS